MKDIYASIDFSTTSSCGILWVSSILDKIMSDLLVLHSSAHSWYRVSNTDLSDYFAFIMLPRKSDYASSNVFSNLDAKAEHE